MVYVFVERANPSVAYLRLTRPFPRYASPSFLIELRFDARRRYVSYFKSCMLTLCMGRAGGGVLIRCYYVYYNTAAHSDVCRSFF